MNPAVMIFAAFVGLVLGLSFYFARKAKSASGYFAAGGSVHWAVNGIAFAGDYLSAASFLGICGLIATKGYDGFLYSIGYLAGWIVALFVVAEPMKRMGKYTFADALDYKFNSKGIQLAAAISTLAVSIFYLIPQMVGAGILVTPLLGYEHWVGVTLVGVVVIFIVATAGMTSTTYVQFLKGALLIIFSSVLVVAILNKGLSTDPRGVQSDRVEEHVAVADMKAQGYAKQQEQALQANNKRTGEVEDLLIHGGKVFKYADQAGCVSWWLDHDGQLTKLPYKATTAEVQTQVIDKVTGEVIEGETSSNIINGIARKDDEMIGLSRIKTLPVDADGKEVTETGSLGPFEFLNILSDEQTEIEQWKPHRCVDGEDHVIVFTSNLVTGDKVMVSGRKFLKKVAEGKEDTFWDRMDFMSLMLALFCGTAALPHILIRYYTVPDAASARKSTILAIGAIAFFYVLTLFLGLGALAFEVVPENGNMAAPMVAKVFGVTLFAIISAIAFATVLGTVSGLIVASSGAIAHDLMDRYMGMNMSDEKKVIAGKLSAVGVGIIAIILGILFEKVNVTFLVGWAFAVAASANLPSIVMLLFWKKTTASGIVASIVVGTVTALGLILISPNIYDKVYNVDGSLALISFNNPGMISIPLSFITLVVVSLMTQKDAKAE